MKKIQYILEYIIFRSFTFLVSLLPVKTSSYFVGKFFAHVGPLLPVNKVAHKNLVFAFPEKNYQERKKIIKLMWENLGRVVGEFPSTYSQTHSDFQKNKCIGFDALTDVLNSPEGKIMITGHFGNWENLLSNLSLKGINFSIIYRKLNNPYIDRYICKQRSKRNLEQIPKNIFSTKKILKALQNGRFVGLLLDQKQNQGVESKFFGKELMTGTLPAKLAIEKNIPIYTAMSVRDFSKGDVYSIHIGGPIIPTKDDDVRTFTIKLDKFYEDWIKKYPEQWFWLHKRWPKKEYKLQ